MRNNKYLIVGLITILFSTVSCVDDEVFEEEQIGMMPNGSPLRLNEILSSGIGDDPDFIEVFNGGTESIDISGYWLNDDVTAEGGFQIPNGTSIEAGGFYVVDQNEFGFGISGGGEEVSLSAPNTTLIDLTTTPAFSDDQEGLTWARVTDGDGEFLISTATKGFSNEDDPIDSPMMEDSVLSLNEILTSGIGEDPDFIEIFNSGTESVDISGYLLDDAVTAEDGAFQIPDGTIIEAGGFYVVDQDEFGFGISGGGEEVSLSDPNLTVIDLTETPEFADDQEGMTWARIPDGDGEFMISMATMGISNESTAPEGSVLSLNEILSSGLGDDPDFIEVYNSGTASVDISGYWLNDDVTAEGGFQIPDGTIIEAGGFYVVDQDESDIGVSGGGEEVSLSDPDLNVIDLTETPEFGDDQDGLTWARVTDGDGEFMISTATKGISNESTASNVLFLNEILTSGLGEDPDFIEVFNSGTATLDISGYWLNDDVTAEGGFQIPEGTIIAPGGFYVVDQDEFGFGISGGGEEVSLSDSDLTVIDLTETPEFMDDQDGLTWARVTDGDGEFMISTATKGVSNETTMVDNSVLSLNEILTSGLGDDPDFIEIFNNGTESIDISGYFLDDETVPNPDDGAFEIPAGTIIGPGEFYVVDQDEFGFGIGGGGEEVSFSTPDLTIIDFTTTPDFAPEQDGMTWSRIPDGVGDFVISAATKGVSNE